MATIERRYDIDWVRVIAIGLLLIYHLAIGFQAWGMMIGFIVNEQTWESLWVPMAMLNVWRIPLLFFVSGMGVYFAMQKRTWKELISERTWRILLPYVFGIFVIVPIHVYLLHYYYSWQTDYNPNPAHLWFLGNIFSYIILLLPIFYLLKRNEGCKLVISIKKLFSSLGGLFLVAAVFIIEALVVNPKPYEFYAMTWHGFVLGLLAFMFGFLFVFTGSGFWNMLGRWKWLFLISASLLFVNRLFQPQMAVPAWLLSIESNVWVFSVFAFSHQYLNKKSKILQYLSSAAYPVYIMHMVFLYLGSLMIFPLSIDVRLKFVLVFVFTMAGCFTFYELFIRRIKFLRPVFGLKG